MQIDALYRIFLQHRNVCTDNRKVQKGDLFFALKGERFDGNQFAEAALQAGAAYAVVDDASLKNNPSCIWVEDSLKCLQDLALHHRSKFRIPLLAITGSNGKTTSKELIASVVSKKYKLHYTKGNLNNHIGIPLTLLAMPDDCEFAVIEMGANHQHEIEAYCLYTQPTHGLITNIGRAHLEGFGGIEGVEKAKTELYRYLYAHQACIFYCGDSEVLKRNVPADAVQISYGQGGENSVRGYILEKTPYLKVMLQLHKKEYVLNTQLSGAYNLENVLAAACVGQQFDVSAEDIQKGISEYAPDNNRSQIKNIGSNTYILDAYNANPSSMKLALENFEEMPAAHKIAILGDMLELGSYENIEHERITQQAIQMTLDYLLFIGPRFYRLSESHASPTRLFFPDTATARQWWQTQSFENFYILLKGSRGIGVENILSPNQ